MQSGLYSLLMLALVLGALMVILFLYKKTLRFRFSGNSQVEIMNQIPIGSKERLLVLKVDTQLVLVGVTADSMTTLHTWSAATDLPVFPDKDSYASV
jgi:flagellar protein FliO/FliZ